MVTTVKMSQFVNANLNNSTNQMAGVSSSSGGINIKSPFTSTWTTATRPAMPYDGLLGYNTITEVYEYYNATLGVWSSLQNSADTGTVTQVSGNNGLVANPSTITTIGSLGLAPIVSNTILANATGSTAIPIPTTLSSLMDSSFSSTQGSIIYRGSSGWQTLAPGISGKFLETISGDSVQWSTPAGSGAVEPGTMYELGFYQVTGSSIYPLATANNGILVTGGSGEPSISSTAPAGLTIPQPIIQGITNGSSPASGQVGELLTNSASGTPMPNNTYVSLASISVPAGIWMISGSYRVTESSPGLFSQSLGGIGINSNASNSPDVGVVAGDNTFGQVGFTVPTIIVNITTTTSYYLTAYVFLQSGAFQGTATMSALRVA